MLLKIKHLYFLLLKIKDNLPTLFPAEQLYQLLCSNHYPESKVHGANMGPIWGRQDPGGPHVGSMNFAIWVGLDLMEHISQQQHDNHFGVYTGNSRCNMAF